MSNQRPPDKPRRRPSIHTQLSQTDVVSFEQMNRVRSLEDMSKVTPKLSNSSSSRSLDRANGENETPADDSRDLEQRQNRENSNLEKQQDECDFTYSESSDQQDDFCSDTETKSEKEQSIKHQEPVIPLIKSPSRRSKKLLVFAESLTNKSSLNYKRFLVMIAFVLVCISVIIAAKNSNNTQPEIRIEDLKSEFPTQDEDFWPAIESGISDIILFNRPSVFILLYTEKSQKYFTKMLNKISYYASCKLKDCSTQHITLTNRELNSPEVIADFGILIEKYKPELEDKPVMVIEDLQDIPSQTAPVFHTFCDEFTPMVPKSLFIFTMKVERFEPNTIMFLDEFLKTKWKDIKVDAFNALFTRITNMVLEVKP